MSTEFPLYPDLSEEGKAEAQQFLDNFKVKMKQIAQEVLDNLYTDTISYIESDSWINFRNELLDGFCKYNNCKIQAKYDFAKIRQTILTEHRADIINDLNQDLVEENENLKKQLADLREWNNRSRY